MHTSRLPAAHLKPTTADNGNALSHRGKDVLGFGGWVVPGVGMTTCEIRANPWCCKTDLLHRDDSWVQGLFAPAHTRSLWLSTHLLNPKLRGLGLPLGEWRWHWCTPKHCGAQLQHSGAEGSSFSRRYVLRVLGLAKKISWCLARWQLP